MAKQNTQANETCCSTNCFPLSPAGSCRLEVASGRAGIRFPGDLRPSAKDSYPPGVRVQHKGNPGVLCSLLSAVWVSL